MIWKWYIWKSAKFGFALTMEGRQDFCNEQPQSNPHSPPPPKKKGGKKPTCKISDYQKGLTLMLCNPVHAYITKYIAEPLGNVDL